MKNIIKENKTLVRSIIRRLTGSDNEDIEQEVYIKIWRFFPGYREQGKFRQWLGRVTANLCRDYFRSRGYRQDKLNIGEDHAAGVCAGQKTAEEALDAKMRQKIILKAVDSLPRNAREVIILFEFEEYSLEEISRRLKIPAGTVKSRLFNARKTLSRKLDFLKEDFHE